MNRYRANWESLKTHRVPAWFDNAKLGIFIHWGAIRFRRSRLPSVNWGPYRKKNPVRHRNAGWDGSL